jgi:hypothetical protein
MYGELLLLQCYNSVIIGNRQLLISLLLGSSRVAENVARTLAPFQISWIRLFLAGWQKDEG